MTMEQINEVYKKAIEEYSKSMFVAGKGTSPKQIGKIVSEIRKDYIEENFNPDLTIEQNCKILKVSKKTMIKWMKEKGVDKQTKIQNIISKIKEVYNPELSIKENYNSEIIQSLNISIHSFKKYIKQI